MLISQEALKYFCYAIFYRDAQGYWFAYVRSISPPSTMNTLRVEIRIKKSGSNEVRKIYLYNNNLNGSCNFLKYDFFPVSKINLSLYE